MTRSSELLSENLAAAQKIGERLVQACQRLDGVLPLASAVEVGSLDDDTVAWIDAFLKRWENLQDMLEGQIVRGLVILEGETDRIQTRRDRANFLEKLGLVSSANDWFEAGELRNRLAHSYPLSNPKQIQRINAAVDSSTLLLETFNRLVAHVRKKNLATLDSQVGELRFVKSNDL